MSEPTIAERGEIIEMRERLEAREAMAALQATYRRRRADRRARERQSAIRRRAQLAGETAAARAAVAGSGEARAEQVRGTQRLAICLLLPVMVAFGAWSTAGVQAGMVAMLGLDPASPAAAMAWAVEPALLGVVAAAILLRARLQAAGGDLDERASYVEFGALGLSIALNMAGHWPEAMSPAAVAALAGHALGPIGAAGAAYMIAVVQDGVHHADPWTLPDGSRAPSLADRAHEQEEDEQEEHGRLPATPRWEQVRPGARVRVGGARIAGWVPAGERPLLPLECAARARARQHALAEGSAAVAELTAWRAAGAHERRRAGALAAAAGGERPALPEGGSTGGELRFARARTAPSTGRTGPESAGTAARRAAGASTRERIAAHLAEHPGDSAEQVAEAVGVHVTTVRRHLRRMAPAPA